MSEFFNPYHRWFGIHPSEEDVSYYRLLGLADFENDIDVIDIAADSRLAILKTVQHGIHAEWSQHLATEVLTVRNILTDSGRKANYDSSLRELRKPKSHTQTANLTPSVPITKIRIRWKRRKERSTFSLFLEIVLGGVVGLSLAYVVAFYLVHFDPLHLEPIFRAMDGK